MDTMFTAFNNQRRKNESIELDEDIPPAQWSIKMLFYIYKTLKSLYMAVFFYFFPLYFTILPVSILINYCT